MKRRMVRLLATCLLACSLPSGPVRADILIEAYAAQRPADAEVVLAAFRAELEASGVNVRAPDIVAAAGDQLPLPGTSDPTLDPRFAPGLRDQVALGTKQVFRGDYPAGLATLEDVLARARANPALVVVDASSRAWLTRTYAAIAFAQIRSQRVEAARAAIAEQIRSFPEDPIGRSVGPEVAALADDVRRKLDTGPHGTLQLTVSQADVAIFVDEHARGAGTMTGTAVPGVYRVLLVGRGTSRRYAVRVVPDKATVLRIDWDADAAFTVAPWIGVPGMRGNDERMHAAAARYAHSSRQHDVIVASIVEHAGRRFVSGAIFEKNTGVLLRHADIALGAGAEACQRALAQHLLTGAASPCLIDLASAAAPQVPTLAKAPPHDALLGPGLVASAGVVALIGGATVMMSKQDPASGTPGYVGWPGVSLVAGGGLALGAAIWWAERITAEAGLDAETARRSNAPIYVAASTAVAAFVAGGYLLHIDGNGTCGGDRSREQCPYRYAVAGQAWTFLGAGVAAAGLGVYWRLRRPGAGKAAIVTVAPTTVGELASVQGSF